MSEEGEYQLGQDYPPVGKKVRNLVGCIEKNPEDGFVWLSRDSKAQKPIQR